MLRSLVRSLETALQLNKPLNVNAESRVCIRRTLFSQPESNAVPRKPLVTAAAGTTPGGSETDNEYVPYRPEHETGTKASVLIEALRDRFRFTDAELQRIMTDDVVYRNYRTRSLASTLDTLQVEGVSRRSIVEYPWMLGQDSSESYYSTF